MRQITVMLKPASSLCNMRCAYCFYNDVSEKRDVRDYGIMEKETAEPLVKNILTDLSAGDRLTFAFQGGEPTLAGISWFKDFISFVKTQPQKVKVSYAIQTNGTMLDGEWCSLFKANRFLVGLSLDGYAELHNRNRGNSFSKVLKAKQLLEKTGVQYNVLSVLTGEAARHPQKIWNFIKTENIRYTQFIPCLDSLDAGVPDKRSVTPGQFRDFYAGIFPLWRRSFKEGDFFSIKLFDDIVQWFMLGRTSACGMNGRCSPQFVVEADGGVYPCDFYMLDRYKIGNFKEDSLLRLYESAAAAEFRAERRTLPPICGDCRYKPACGGGCKRMQAAMYTDIDGSCGFRLLLDDIYKELAETVQPYV